MYILDVFEFGLDWTTDNRVTCPCLNVSHWSVVEHRTRKQDIELGNYTTQNLENMADLHGES